MMQKTIGCLVLFFFLNELNVKFSGNIVYGESPIDNELTFVHKSKPLSDIIKSINKYSNNVMAENLYHTLAPNIKSKTMKLKNQRI